MGWTKFALLGDVTFLDTGGRNYDVGDATMWSVVASRKVSHDVIGAMGCHVIMACVEDHNFYE